MTRSSASNAWRSAGAVFLLAAAACSSPDPAGTADPQAAGTPQPAPARDISGVWAGPPLPALQETETTPFTPEGQARYEANRPTWGPRAVGLAESNDPLITCDPLGFPRSMLYETRGFEFLHTPAKTVQLLQYQRAFREIWTDGRPLPAGAGSEGGDATDPRWYGYSTGRWEDDRTFVVETVGADERTWLDYMGRPHSAGARFEERYTRPDFNVLEVSVTVTDPQYYARPFVAMRQTFERAQVQELEEQLCVPSEAIEYYRTIAQPAGVN